VRHSRHLTVLQTAASTIVALGIILAPTWQWILKPILVGTVTTALAQDLDTKITHTVARELRPLEAGLKAIIEGNIANLENEISRLEYRRDYDAGGEWTDDHRRELLAKQRALAAQRAALAAIEAEKSGN